MIAIPIISGVVAIGFLIYIMSSNKKAGKKEILKHMYENKDIDEKVYVKYRKDLD